MFGFDEETGREMFLLCSTERRPPCEPPAPYHEGTGWVRTRRDDARIGYTVQEASLEYTSGLFRCRCVVLALPLARDVTHLLLPRSAPLTQHLRPRGPHHQAEVTVWPLDHTTHVQADREHSRHEVTGTHRSAGRQCLEAPCSLRLQYI